MADHSNPCEQDGTCDHTDYPTMQEYCEANPEASFCRGPSDPEGRETIPPEPAPSEPTPSEPMTAEPVVAEETTTEVPVSPAPAETLPETGLAGFSGLALVGASLIAMGGMILRRT